MKTLASILLSVSIAAAGDLSLDLRTRPAEHPVQTPAVWPADKVALIICDVWDQHHSQNAANRTAELAPVINTLAQALRQQGALVIHAPSDCMKFYADHPAHKRALENPPADNLPKDLGKWCYWKDATEEQAGYPLAAGEDDLPEAAQQWLAKLAAQGRNPKLPWVQQHPAITIDNERDLISDQGPVIWNALAARGIKRVLLCGVHTNLCVLGRSFGLRQLSRHGLEVALVRDLTDALLAKPTGHFRGTERIVEHIEHYVCPTISSEQILGGAPFHFAADRRPHLVMVIGEDEYHTWESLNSLTVGDLAEDYRVTFVNPVSDPFDFPGLSSLSQADGMVMSAQRRCLIPAQMKFLRDYVAAGKPVVGIRTASHSWHLRNNAPPAPGHVDWPTWDAEVIHGNYQNHYANEFTPTIAMLDTTKEHPIFVGVDLQGFKSGGSLYRNTPLPEASLALLNGTAANGKTEPVAWTTKTDQGGKVFYTSLGHPKDFENPTFRKLITNAIHWAIPIPAASK